MENGRLAYAFNGEAITPDRIPEKLSGEIYKFGTKQSLEIVISDQVPLAALLEVDRLVKESGMEGPVGFSLARVNEAPPKSSDPILGGEEALFSITLTPMPERREDKR